eukprot:2246419-Pleurochrysis_carterae.AAC.1
MAPTLLNFGQSFERACATIRLSLLRRRSQVRSQLEGLLSNVAKDALDKARRRVGALIATGAARALRAKDTSQAR